MTHRHHNAEEEAPRKAIKTKKANKEDDVADAPDGQVSKAEIKRALNDEEAGASSKVTERTVTATLPPGHLSHSRDIYLVNFSLNFYGTVLIHDTELKLSYGNRYGLIGHNGCGKSTFLTALGKREVPIQDHIDIFYLDREVEALDINAMDFIISDIEAKVAKLEKYAEVVMDSLGPDAMELDEIYERIDAMDIATAPRRAGEILHGLGFTKEMMAQPTRDFSGGWRMRISLAKALFLEPALLLLDDPTSHLDLEATLWLESYLAKYPACLVLVSHSEDFLDNVCTHIIDLRLQRLSYYTGNYSAYVRTRSENEENQRRAYEKQQNEIAHMKQYVARFGHGNSKMARQAQSKEKLIAKMEREGLVEAVVVDRKLKLSFPNPPPLAPPVLSFTDVTFGYTPEKLLFEHLEFGIDLDSRVVLVGANGAGKSTFLKLLKGDLNPLEGRIQAHAHCRIGFYSQHLTENLPLDRTPFDGGIDGMRSILGRFGLSGKAQVSPIRHLSGGQVRRLGFAYLAQTSPSMIVMDEPTNGLSMDAIDALADALNEFEGGVVVVSHDFRLLERMERAEIFVTENKSLNRWNGSIMEYKQHLQAIITAQHEAYISDNM
ncbi:uncharacterized protein AMSG_02423 [Thecamonas trahens ATCC 50062]|uniref:ABC transporter domain-containing protein n=1 Tax=Thecamonas trahens ATCC 50062 TaxID=461836 RepID=A0A0L0DY24_THETB|nr:hypothetical protein AMSG_02423 [Thecamonas trahens ATCC 50062]KNC56453.1 hypothetical protein AMSG_02423 [Thecamonas trahens ATCC 50062]|eukprot:XP_013760965.1 hypothetical protein AMSG_02423 [Thecamonas trahens ATCC 50062]